VETVNKFGVNLFIDTPFKSLEIISRIGYRYVDYGSHFNFHTLPKGTLESIAEKTASLGLIPFSLHHPYCLHPSLDSESSEAKEREICEVVETAGRLNVRYLTIHPGVVEGLDNDLDLLAKYLCETDAEEVDRLDIHFLSVCCEYAADFGITIAIENLPFIVGNGRLSGRYCNTADDLLRLISMMKAAGHLNIAACFDTGHANLCGLDIPASILKLRDNLCQLHLNDNRGELKPNSEGDVHLVPGRGNINWPEVKRALHSIGYTGPIMFEFGSRSGNPAEDILSEAIEAWKKFEA
jgi:sugar phosphate isomerase/epimerase